MPAQKETTHTANSAWAAHFWARHTVSSPQAAAAAMKRGMNASCGFLSIIPSLKEMSLVPAYFCIRSR